MLKSNLDALLAKQSLPAQVLLSRFNMTESSRNTRAYNDSLYAPFYYHLGKLVKPDTFAEFGVGIGILGCSFLISCKSINFFLAFQEKSSDPYSFKLAKPNIKSVYSGQLNIYNGKITDEIFVNTFNQYHYGMVLINEVLDCTECLNFVWPRMKPNGLIVIDNLLERGDEFDRFCRSYSRKPIKFKTRYGTGIVRR